MTPDEIRAAVERADRSIRPHVVETPLRRSDHLSRLTGAEVLCKLENLQVTGSFKARGAANKIAALSAAERARGIVTASSGNHGAAVAAMLARFGGRGIVYVPVTTPKVKVDAIRGYGAEVRLHSNDSGEAEVFARAYAEVEGLTYIPPYNDPDVIAGQGTIGAEIERQAPQADVVAVAVGGGGLVSGIAGFLKARKPKIRILGALPLNDHAMLLSVRAGKVVAHADARPTLSDGTAGSVEAGSITLPLCRDLVDDWMLVDEDQIAVAMRNFMAYDNQMIEGAAGVAIAGLLNLAAQQPGSVKGKTVVIIICGARIDLSKLATVIAG
ncbi:MAG: threonine/serine dehydratase [Rhizobiales bacterium]|nr:threonine/serine dehydratase [Hyphomicrobiales bacterium]MBI3674164.1 threonine/serine dehydratase [Hyphomicrobiales bacterium]